MSPLRQRMIDDMTPDRPIHTHTLQKIFYAVKRRARIAKRCGIRDRSWLTSPATPTALPSLTNGSPATRTGTSLPIPRSASRQSPAHDDSATR